MISFLLYSLGLNGTVLQASEVFCIIPKGMIIILNVKSLYLLCHQNKQNKNILIWTAFYY